MYVIKRPINPTACDEDCYLASHKDMKLFFQTDITHPCVCKFPTQNAALSMLNVSFTDEKIQKYKMVVIKI